MENYVILGMVSYAADVKTVPPRKKDVRGTDKGYTDSILLTRSAIGVLIFSEQGRCLAYFIIPTA